MLLLVDDIPKWNTICYHMWQIEPSTQMERDLKWYEKKRPNEIAAVFGNLDRYLTMLNSAKNSKCVEAGYLHHEPAGVVAVDQKGFSGNLEETRLYTFAVDETKTLYLITVGNKADQHSDIELSKQFVESLSRNEAEEEP